MTSQFNLSNFAFLQNAIFSLYILLDGGKGWFNASQYKPSRTIQTDGDKFLPSTAWGIAWNESIKFSKSSFLLLIMQWNRSFGFYLLLPWLFQPQKRKSGKAQLSPDQGWARGIGKAQRQGNFPLKHPLRSSSNRFLTWQHNPCLCSPPVQAQIQFCSLLRWLFHPSHTCLPLGRHWPKDQGTSPMRRPASSAPSLWPILIPSPRTEPRSC